MSLLIARIGLLAQGVVDWANGRLGVVASESLPDTRSSWEIFRDSLDAGNTIARLPSGGIHVNAEGDLDEACAMLLRKEDMRAFVGEHLAFCAHLAAATASPDMLGEAHLLDIDGIPVTLTMIHRVYPGGQIETVGGSTE